MSHIPGQTSDPAGEEGFVEIDGEAFYMIPAVDRLPPFLMSIVSDADHWMFVSSLGGLTAGRGSSATALFPYETDDRLHRAGGSTGPVTAFRRRGSDGETIWEPFRGEGSPGVRRNLFKSVVGNQVIFEEVHRDWGLVFRYRWSNSDRFGFVRTVTLSNIGEPSVALDFVDGLLNLLPFGLEPSLYQRMSNLTNAYKRSELIDEDSRLAAFSLESHVTDRPEPAEALVASVVWSDGLDEVAISLDGDLVETFRTGRVHSPRTLVTGRPGVYLLSGTFEVASREVKTWHIVADVGQDQRDVAELRKFLRASSNPAAEVAVSVGHGTESLTALMAGSDAQQRTADRLATAHHVANVTYNVMRGGIFRSGYEIPTADFAIFVATRNRAVARRHQPWLEGLPELIERRELLRRVEKLGDAHLNRLCLEYLPLTFSRRHGDPSRPWNAFSIRVRTADGQPIIHYEGNWRDVFQNWEALCLSFPEYLPSFVSVFVNASTADGFNPYRITRDGIDWEVPDPDDPWSNIGYWGDHQVVYLLRLLTAADRYLPGDLEALLGRKWFSYADVPYRIAPYEEMVQDPKATIRYDRATADRSAVRVEQIGHDGKLLPGTDGQIHLVTLLEKLLVPALSKLSNYVPGGGIWMNTQRPEWNDANNALVGHGLSVVTLCYLRPYLLHLTTLIANSRLTEVQMSIEVADWLGAVNEILRTGTGGQQDGLSDQERKELVGELGAAFDQYRSRVYASGFSGTAPVDVSQVVELCRLAVDHLDDGIRRNRRPDGLYHSYNLVDFSTNGSAASVEHLSAMLEGQVAVLGSGLLTATERAEVIETLFASSMFRPDQGSLMLYPVRSLPSFLEKNVVPGALIEANPLLRALTVAGETSVIVVDVDGRYRFNSTFRNAGDLDAELDRMACHEDWRTLVSTQRAAVLEAYEEVFRHHGYTGRSGSMYGYEGIGSIYWHMVAKLLVTVQEAVVEAGLQTASADTLRRLVESYWRVRSGLGFNKTAVEYGAFPTDPYSHTPSHAGAQQPGMTGQVKEELLTRLLEVGLRVQNGEIWFDPVLLRLEEFLPAPETWQVEGVDGKLTEIGLPPRSLGATFCQVPVVVSLTSEQAVIEIVRADGTRDRRFGLRIDRETSRAIFGRTGQITRIHAFIPEADMSPVAIAGSTTSGSAATMIPQN